MPLMKRKSEKAFSHNVRAEMESGKSQKQALAIAYATKRRARKMSAGGIVRDDEELGKFLTNEADETPFHSIDYDDSEASGLYEDYDLNNTEGDADQDAARREMVARIMAKRRR